MQLAHFLFYCSDLITSLIGLPNAFLEKEALSPEKKIKSIFLELYAIISKKSIVCVRNKLKPRSTDIRFRH